MEPEIINRIDRTSLEEFTEAQELLTRIINFFDGKNDIETMLARVELAQCHLKAGQVGDGQAMLRDVHRSLPTLASVRVQA